MFLALRILGMKPIRVSGLVWIRFNIGTTSVVFKTDGAVQRQFGQ